VRHVRLGLLGACWAGALALAAAAVPVHAAAVASTGARAPVVSGSLHNDTSAPLRDLRPTTTRGRTHPVRHVPVQSGGAVSAPDTSGARSAAARLTPTPSVNFDGDPDNSGVVPPDNDGAAGPTQFVELVNSQLAVYSKTGTILLGPENTNTLWSGFGGGCQTNNDGDGTVDFDTLSQRWVIQQFSVGTTPFLECVAVSTSSDATGSYNRYSFQPSSSFPDYPKLGVWPDAYYVSYNLFNAASTQGLGTQLCAYDRAKMIQGQPATQQCFLGTTAAEKTALPATLDGSTAPPAGAPEWFVGLSPTSANALASYRFHVDFATPANSTLTGPTDLPVNAFSPACGGAGTCIPQSGTTQQLDSLGDRLMYRLAYRNFGDHEAMVVTHSVVAGSSVGQRWYELRPSGSTLSVFQQGNYAPDSSFRWMGSAAMDHSGDIALGFSVSSSSQHPGIAYTGRLAGDPAGTMPQGEVTVFTGGGSQTGSNGANRWGDYTEMTVDPTDDCTFWYVNEYVPSNGNFNWHTRVASFKFPSCGATGGNDFSLAVSPASQTVTAGQGTSYAVSTTVTSGSATSVSLSAGGLPSGASATFSPNPVTSGGSSTMAVTTSASTPASTSTITVTGTSSSTSHSATTSLTVTSGGGGGTVVTNGGFESGSLSGWTTAGAFAPRVVSSPVHSGSFAAQLGSTGPVNGDSTLTQTVTVPAGSSTLSFWYNPHCTDSITFDQQQAQIRSTAGATLATVLNVCSNSGAWTHVTFDTSQFAGQTVVLWFNDHDDGFASPPDPTWYFLDDVSITASTGGGGNVVTNGGFETGSLSGWTAAGAFLPRAVTSPVHTGSFAAQLGSTGAVNGDSTLTQTIAVPSGSSTLSFWYNPHCTDSVTFDQQQAQIRSTAGATLATVLNVCSNTATWTHVTFDTSQFAGQTVVLWFNDHDDGFASPPDPTWFFLDDVSVS
jgi:hypothetical protein